MKFWVGYFLGNLTMALALALLLMWLDSGVTYG